MAHNEWWNARRRACVRGHRNQTHLTFVHISNFGASMPRPTMTLQRHSNAVGTKQGVKRESVQRRRNMQLTQRAARRAADVESSKNQGPLNGEKTQARFIDQRIRGLGRRVRLGTACDDRVGNET